MNTTHNFITDFRFQRFFSHQLSIINANQWHVCVKCLHLLNLFIHKLCTKIIEEVIFHSILEAKVNSKWTGLFWWCLMLLSNLQDFYKNMIKQSLGSNNIRVPSAPDRSKVVRSSSGQCPSVEPSRDQVSDVHVFCLRHTQRSVTSFCIRHQGRPEGKTSHGQVCTRKIPLDDVEVGVECFSWVERFLRGVSYVTTCQLKDQNVI